MALGLISMPVMLRLGYNHRFASGVIAAAGTLAQVLPPNIVLIVLAEQLDVPLIDIYRGAFIPGGNFDRSVYFTYIAAVTWWNPQLAPAAVREGQTSAKFRGWSETLLAAGLPLALVLAVLASIGVAAPSEGGAIGPDGRIAARSCATPIVNAESAYRRAISASWCS
jgi:TRAP-type mannitol/chloroaromatic compound transport system permease large subunit